LNGRFIACGDAQSVLLLQQLARVIRLTVMMYVRHPLSLRQVKDLLVGRGIDICHERLRFWSNRFGPTFATARRRIFCGLPQTRQTR
jgi:transposase-like protein